jgi:hypothetical protein
LRAAKQAVKYAVERLPDVVGKEPEILMTKKLSEPLWSDFAELRKKLTNAIRTAPSKAAADAACEKIKLAHQMRKAPSKRRAQPL